MYGPHRKTAANFQNSVQSLFTSKKENFNKFPIFFFLKKNRTLLLRLLPYIVAPGPRRWSRISGGKFCFFLFFFLRIHFLMQMGSTLSPHAGHLRCGREQNTFVFAFDSTARLVIYGEFVEVIEMKRQNEWPNMTKMRKFELNFSKNNYLAFFLQFLEIFKYFFNEFVS